MYKLIYNKTKNIKDYKVFQVSLLVKTKEDLKDWLSWLDYKKYKYIIK